MGSSGRWRAVRVSERVLALELRQAGSARTRVLTHAARQMEKRQLEKRLDVTRRAVRVSERVLALELRHAGSARTRVLTHAARQIDERQLEKRHIDERMRGSPILRTTR